MVMGPLVDNLELLETIEQLGASIVADDVTNGSRYFDLDVGLDGNLYENLAKRYLQSGPSPTINTDIHDDERFFRRRVADLNPDGIIFINQKFCEPHVHNYLAKLEILKQMKLNTLMLEVEHDRAVVSERDLLRIESFIEMLGEG
jgi:benzoyl-CoA reductase subunit C